MLSVSVPWLEDTGASGKVYSRKLYGRCQSEGASRTRIHCLARVISVVGISCCRDTKGVH